MVKKLSINPVFLLIFLMISVSLVSAMDWDNKLDYSNQDLTATFSNSFLGIFQTSEIGNATLKSHVSTAQVLEVAPGNDRVVMFYDFDFSEEYENGLGTVEFKNMRSGETINKDYHFVIWGTKTETRNQYETICTPTYNGTNQTETCEQIITGTYEEEVEGWIDFDTTNIPQGNARIGLVTDVVVNDYVDGVWEIVGKKVGKHASWTANLDVGLVSYYKLDEETGTTAYDSLGLNNGTISNADINKTGKINNSFEFTDASDDRVRKTSASGLGTFSDGTPTGTINFWVYPKDKGASNNIGGLVEITTNSKVNNQYMAISMYYPTTTTMQLFYNTGVSTYDYVGYSLSRETWQMVTVVYSNSDTATFYINGVLQGTSTLTLNSFSNEVLTIGNADDLSSYTARVNAKIDEVGFWNRSLNSTEITQLYNNGTGITYEEITGGNLTILYPTATTYNAPVTQLNYTNSSDMNKCWYSTDGGATNSSPITCGTNFTGLSSIEGSNTWTLYGNDTLGNNYTDSVTFTQDTTPNIQYTAPTPANASSLTETYLPINVTLTETYFQNITFNFYLEGSLNDTQTFTNSTRFYNKTNATEGNWIVNVTTCTTFGSCNTTERRYILLDVSPPIINGTSPNGTYFYLAPNETMDVNWTIIDEGVGLDQCWYIYNGVRTDVNCTANHSQFNYTTGVNNLTGYANDTLGQEINVTINWSVVVDSYNQGSDYSVAGEGTAVTFNLSVNYSLTHSATATLYLNGTAYSPDTTTITTGYNFYEKTINIPDGWGNSTGNTLDWYWIYNSTTYSDYINTTLQNLTIFSMDIDNCSAYGDVILNFTLKGEAARTILFPPTTNDTNIEIDLEISGRDNPSTSWTYSNQWLDDADGNVQICVPSGVLNYSEYRMDFTLGFVADGYVQEFFYLDNGTLDSDKEYNSLTNATIDLYDLLLTDSTTFLFKFYDDDGLEVPNAIVHTFRKYIGEGKYYEVERSKEDDNGETHIHLVEEDVIYYFKVSLNGEILYTSSTYNAKCLSTPCQLELEASQGFVEFDTDFDLVNGTFAVSSNDATREVSLSYTLESPRTINLTVMKFSNNPDTLEVVGSDQAYSTGGVLTVTVPQVAGNITFIAAIYQDGSFVGSEWVDFNESAGDYFGSTGIFMALLLLLTLVLMSASEGEGTIIFTLLGLVIMFVMKLINLGYYSLIGFICAGLIVVWKVAQRRNK